MSIRYYLEESFENLRQNKLRSILTGFGVAWGIFLLVILLGVGEGFYKGVSRKFSGYAQNSVWFWRPQGDVTESILNKLQASVVGIEHIAPIGWFPSSPLNYQNEDYSADVKGVGISYGQVAQLMLGEGRFLNTRDKALHRPVCVIGHEVQTNLFKNEAPIGKFISIDGYYFQVVGTLDREEALNKEEGKAVLVPLQTMQKTFNLGTGLRSFRMSLQPGASSQKIEDEVRAYLAKQLRFDKANPRELYIGNFSKRVQQFNALFQGIRLFLWVIGICMLLSGIVGVSNMMFVLVKERTQEIGIRKVIGASAQEILLMIMTEAISISLVAGTIGMLAGIGGIQLLNQLLDYVDPMQQSSLSHLVFRPSAAIAALVLLVIAGAVAGLMPARRATAILPIKALNSE